MTSSVRPIVGAAHRRAVRWSIRVPVNYRPDHLSRLHAHVVVTQGDSHIRDTSEWTDVYDFSAGKYASAVAESVPLPDFQRDDLD